MRIDTLIPAGDGCGIDVAVQRADDLDNLCLEHIRTVVGSGAESVSALDMACGQGGQAVRMALVGASVVASDAADYAAELQALSAGVGLPPDAAPRFVQSTFETMPQCLDLSNLGVISCQRAIHYLPYEQAVQAVRCFYGMLKHGGRLYISASGLLSELGNGYAHKERPVAERFVPLEASVAQHHAILQPVCLYTEDDMRDLLEAAGFQIETVFSSPFGNVKAVAYR